MGCMRTFEAVDFTWLVHRSCDKNGWYMTCQIDWRMAMVKLEIDRWESTIHSLCVLLVNRRKRELKTYLFFSPVNNANGSLFVWTNEGSVEVEINSNDRMTSIPWQFDWLCRTVKHFSSLSFTHVVVVRRCETLWDGVMKGEGARNSVERFSCKQTARDEIFLFSFQPIVLDWSSDS